jgi:hypothetical protein
LFLAREVAVTRDEMNEAFTGAGGRIRKSETITDGGHGLDPIAPCREKLQLREILSLRPGPMVNVKPISECVPIKLHRAST